MKFNIRGQVDGSVMRKRITIVTILARIKTNKIIESDESDEIWSA